MSVCLLVTFVRPAKTAEPMKVRFGKELTGVGPKNHVLDGVEIHMGRSTFWGVIRHTEKHWDRVSGAVYAAKELTQSSVTARHAMRPFVKIL